MMEGNRAVRIAHDFAKNGSRKHIPDVPHIVLVLGDALIHNIE